MIQHAEKPLLREGLLLAILWKYYPHVIQKPFSIIVSTEQLYLKRTTI